MVAHRALGSELSAGSLYEILRLRSDVFVVEQECAYPELDGRDLAADTVHLWLTDDSDPAESPAVLAYLRLLAEPDSTVRIGRVCTAEAARGRGLGGRLMTMAIAEIGSTDSVLAAQVAVLGFYRSFGYRPVGEVYDEDGIAHQPMARAGDPV
ncbi:putative acyltransferase [Actinoalloteichus hymeniacidonis]|uniref:Acyltransferase n=1 Tax=Actinoalloteichus hymeniacidonis TaxID=340345 RepID=A0AAC9HPH2_9PSEU|nr:putative acyltransferase [Actinoalloteichus hymeniacidonis]